MPTISDEQYLRLLDRSDSIGREAKSIGRKARVLNQQAAQLRDEIAEIAQTEEVTDERSTRSS